LCRWWRISEASGACCACVEMNSDEVLELVKARMGEIESGTTSEGSRKGMGADATGAKLAADIRKKAEARHKSPSERLEYMQRELAKAVCVTICVICFI